MSCYIESIDAVIRSSYNALQGEDRWFSNRKSLVTASSV